MIHTNESLKRMALRTGSVVEIDGKPFNAARAVAPYVEPKAAPTPAPVAPPPDTVTPQIAAHLSAIARATELNASVGIAIEQALANIKPPPPAESRPKKWVWTVIRDSRGLIQRIEATSE